MKQAEVTMYVKIRDAIDEYLESQGPIKGSVSTSNIKIEYESIPWTEAKGQKGPYQRYPAFQQQVDNMNKNYIGLLERIKKNPFFKHAGLSYWLFNDNITIGRKPTKKKCPR